MVFPKSLIIRVYDHLVKNTTESGEVTDCYCDEVPLIELLSRELGFSYKIYSMRVRPDGDFIVGNIVLSEFAFNYTAYPYAIQDFTFAVKKPNYLSNFLASLRPFTMPVWIMLLLSVVLVTCAQFLTFQRRHSLLSVLFYSSVALLGNHRDWKPKSNAQKLLVLPWIVGLTFLSLAYGAAMSSLSTVRVHERDLTSIEELYQAIHGGKATALKLEGSTIDDDLVSSGLEKLKFIGRHLKKQDIVSTGEAGNFLEAIQPNVAVIAERSQLEVLYRGKEHVISTDSFKVNMRTMYCYKFYGFCCMDQFDLATHRIWGAGLVKKIFDDVTFQSNPYNRSKLPNMHSHDESTFTPLNLYDMSGAFYLLITGHILGLICFISEIVVHSYFYQI